MKPDNDLVNNTDKNEDNILLANIRDMINNSSVSKLAQLQEYAKELNINIVKEQNGKIKNKIKNELWNDISDEI